MSKSRIFLDAKRTFDELSRVERQFKKDDHETWPEYLRRTRADRREALLNRLCSERRCQLCHRTYIKSRQWVIARDIDTIVGPIDQLALLRKFGICCRSCWKKYFYREGE